MTDDLTAPAWNVDLAAGLASRGETLIRFGPCDTQGFDLAFVSGRCASLEEQCLIAGEALAAIKAKVRSSPPLALCEA